MPGIFHPVVWGETYLVDGALISPIPVHLLQALGADIEIPMRAIRHRPVAERQRFADIRDMRGRLRPNHRPPDLVRLIWRSLSLILQDQFAEMLMAQYPLSIKVELPFEYAGDPEKVDTIIQLGRDAANEKVAAIKAALAAPIPAAAAD
jgi:predicted acylesterase/phospholipase RssA